MVAVDALRRAAPSGSSFPVMAGAPELDPLFLAFQLLGAILALIATPAAAYRR